MKKILIIIILFFGVVPCLKKGKISIIGVESTYADDYGGEVGDDNGDPCDPSSSAFSIGICNSTDQCDPSSDYYDDTVCEMQTCNPSSVNYNVDECDAAVCDDNSYYTNPDLCENETCLPDNINYNVDECDAQVCDDTSDNFNPDDCEDETCLPDNINYNVDECDAQICDPTSNRYDPVECAKERCDPDNTNYDPSKCQSCDASTPNVHTEKEATSFNYALTNQDYGWTDDESVEFRIGACKSNGVWTAVLLDVRGNFSERIRLLPGVSEVTGVSGNTTSSNFCKQVTDLSNLGYAANTQWYVLGAVQAHEDVHASHLLSSLQQAASNYQSAVTSLTVPDTGQSESDAISQLQGLSSYTTLITNARSIWDGYYATAISNDHNSGGLTDIAEHAVVDPIISSICTYSHSHAWPACSVCP